MIESLEVIRGIIEWLKDPLNKGADPGYLLDLLRGLSAHLYTLEECRADYHKKYEEIIFNEVKKGKSVNQAKNLAETKVPELYMLRRIMEAAYRNVDAIRTTISYKKYEIESGNYGVHT